MLSFVEPDLLPYATRLPPAPPLIHALPNTETHPVTGTVNRRVVVLKQFDGFRKAPELYRKMAAAR